MDATRNRPFPLVEVLARHAEDPTLLTRIDPARLACAGAERELVLLEQTSECQVWLIGWPPGSATGWHDHGSAAGAYTVLQGRLLEHNWRGALKLASVGSSTIRVVRAGHVHDVRNRSAQPALSLHVYAPRLDAMNSYEFLGDRIQLFGGGPGR